MALRFVCDVCKEDITNDFSGILSEWAGDAAHAMAPHFEKAGITDSIQRHDPGYDPKEVTLIDFRGRSFGLEGERRWLDRTVFDPFGGLFLRCYWTKLLCRKCLRRRAGEYRRRGLKVISGGKK